MRKLYTGPHKRWLICTHCVDISAYKVCKGRNTFPRSLTLLLRDLAVLLMHPSAPAAHHDEQYAYRCSTLRPKHTPAQGQIQQQFPVIYSICVRISREKDVHRIRTVRRVSAKLQLLTFKCWCDCLNSLALNLLSYVTKPTHFIPGQTNAVEDEYTHTHSIHNYYRATFATGVLCCRKEDYIPV